MFLPLCLVLAVALRAAEAPPAFPLWDGHEAVVIYAARCSFRLRKTIDLGHGVALELVLIPAGQFIMGAGYAAEPSANLGYAILL